MHFEKQHIIRIVVVPILACIFLLPYLFKEKHDVFTYEIGKPWSYDILVATNTFSINKTEGQINNERDEIMKGFIPYFAVDTSESHSLLVMSLADMEWLHNKHCQQIYILKGKTATLIPLSQVYTPLSAYKITKEEMKPSLVYDSLTSARVLHNQLNQVSTTQGMVQQGEKIIDKGEIVTEEKYQTLSSFFRKVHENDNANNKIYNLIGMYGLIIIVVVIFLLYLYVFRRRYYKSAKDLLFFITLSLLLNFIATFAILHYTILEYVIPFTWIPILTHIFFDSRTALFLHLLNLMLLSCIVPHPFSFFIMQMIAGMVVIVSLRNLTRRSHLMQTAAWVVLSYILTYTLTTFISDTPDILDPYVYAMLVLNGVLVICAYGVVYLFERMFKKTSDITLVELADMNSPVLLQLAEKAPGTFQHSLQVSTIATEAARSIEANYLLVRTAALYHDIGKMVNPWFFTENQRNGYNPLIEKTPEQATIIIKEHVINGVNIINKNHLPNSILPFIKTHHGTSVIKYFYNSAVNLYTGNEGKQMVNIDDFRYPGPKPQSREEAILMMADAIEARSRSLKEFSIEAVTDIVNDTINSQIKDEQFSETDLSFKDITTMRKVFIERIISINHLRIEYPKIDHSDSQSHD